MPRGLGRDNKIINANVPQKPHRLEFSEAAAAAAVF